VVRASGKEVAVRRRIILQVIPWSPPGRACRRLAFAAGIWLAWGPTAEAQQAETPQARSTPSPSIDYSTARNSRRLLVSRAQGAIRLDGVLDDAAWVDVPMAHDFIQNDPREGMPATYDTEVRMVYDDRALYVGVFARDDEPGRLIVSDLKKDYSVDTSDSFRLILDTFHDGRNGYMFATNPAGARWDAQMANEGRESNTNWDAIWDVATRITETGWVAEMRIPYQTIRFSGDMSTWGVNFQRKIRRLNEDSYWSPLPRIWDLDRASLAGTLEGTRGLRPGKDLRVKPYALSSSNTITGSGTNGDLDAGLDVKYGISSGLTLDLTVNTDFSQVEADEQQINLSRFSLFFPEKRDFFLENSGIFQFGGGGNQGGGGNSNAGRQNGAQEMRLFFSRRIGLSDSGSAIPLLAGTRLTGRQGAYSVGVLNIQQRELDSSRPANFTALRMRRDILANSDIGVMMLAREEGGPRDNRVAGLDANFRFGFLTLNGYVAKTFSPQEVAPGEGRDFATRISAGYADRTWQIRGRVDSIGERFNDEMGFVPRRGVHGSQLYVSRAFRPRAISKWVREVRPHWQMDLFTRQQGGALESRYQDWHLPLNFQDGSFLEIGVNPNVEEVTAPFPINTARGVRVSPGRYSFNEYFFLWNTNTAARVSFNLRYSVGDFYDGTRRGYIVGPTVRINEQFNAGVNVQFNDIDVSAGSFLSTLVTGRLNYNFNTRMFLNALLQHNTDTRQWSSNVRFNIIHRPLSDIFLVYSDRHDERSGTLIDRALVAKMTYLVAF
jgi:hypothetical protein